MKKSVGIALAAGALVLAYPAAAWMLGRQVEAAHAEQYRLLAEQPYTKVVARDYQRSLFGATETVTIELLGDLLRDVAKAPRNAAADPAAPAETPQALRLTLRSTIQHGPLPGLTTLAAAVADSELTVEGEPGEKLAAVLGGQKPLLAHTEYRFTGGGVSRMSSPAFAMDFPADAEGTTSSVAWDGIHMSVDFAKGMQRYTMQAEAPRLEIKDSAGLRVLLSGLRLDGEQQRMFDDEPLLYAGTQKITVAQFGMTTGKEDGEALLVKQVVYDVAMPANGDFLDIVARTGAETVQFGAHDYGPAHYDFSFKHLHARTLAKLHRAFMKQSADPAALAAGEANPAKMLAPLAEPALELLKYSPEISVDRISFRSPHGEALIAARARLGELKPEEISNPLVLLGKLDASADIALPEALLAGLGGKGEAGAEAVAMREAMFQQQLAGFAEQGYIQRDGGVLRTKIAFANGQLTINGKPFNPLAMGGGARPTM